MRKEKITEQAERPVRGDHKYRQVIHSPEEHEERAGRSLVTTGHDVIRKWAEERDATPATVPGTEHEGRPGVLRFDFPGYGGQELKHIPWEEWFTTFDERRLNFIQEHKKDGAQSNFFRRRPSFPRERESDRDGHIAPFDAVEEQPPFLHAEGQNGALPPELAVPDADPAVAAGHFDAVGT